MGVDKKVFKKPPNNSATVKWSIAVHLCQLFATFRNIKITFVLSWCMLDISRLLIHFPFHSQFLEKALPAHTDRMGLLRGRSLRSTRRKFTIYLRSYKNGPPTDHVASTRLRNTLKLVNTDYMYQFYHMCHELC